MQSTESTRQATRDEIATVLRDAELSDYALVSDTPDGARVMLAASDPETMEPYRTVDAQPGRRAEQAIAAIEAAFRERGMHVRGSVWDYWCPVKTA